MLSRNKQFGRRGSVGALLALIVGGASCRPATEPGTTIGTGTRFAMMSRNGSALPQRTVASPTDTTMLLGGELLVVTDREWHVIDSVRVSARDATQWYSDVHNSERVGYGSIVGNAVQLTWQGGGRGDLIVFNSGDQLTVTRAGGDTVRYRRR